MNKSTVTIIITIIITFEFFSKVGDEPFPTANTSFLTPSNEVNTDITKKLHPLPRPPTWCLCFCVTVSVCVLSSDNGGSCCHICLYWGFDCAGVHSFIFSEAIRSGVSIFFVRSIVRLSFVKTILQRERSEDDCRQSRKDCPACFQPQQGV